MCTLTWGRTHDGYSVFFNRDEQRTRPPAEPPRQMSCEGVTVLAPRDPQGGGTWLAVNEVGVTLGLLNYYAADSVAHVASPRSRGCLVSALMAVHTPGEAWAGMEKMDLAVYRPFILVGFYPDGRAEAAHWDGVRLKIRTLTEDDRPVTTSSYRSAEVEARRRQQFPKLSSSLEALRAYHIGRDPLGDAYSVWMSRPDAHTVSLSQVVVAADRVAFSYAPCGPHNQPGPDVVLQVPRR